MNQENETDQLQELLGREYGAPPLNEQFSATVIRRMQALAPRTIPVRSSASVFVCLVTVATVLVAFVGVSQIESPPSRPELLESYSLSTTELHRESRSGGVLESQALAESARPTPLDAMSRRNLEQENLAQLSKQPLHESEARTIDERLLRENKLSDHLSVMSRERRLTSFAIAATTTEVLYVIDREQLHELDPTTGFLRLLGKTRWPNTTAMTTMQGHIYLISNGQLYKVNPDTGSHRQLGTKTWGEAKTLSASGDSLYIIANQRLHRVNRTNGKSEVVPIRKDGSTRPMKSNP